MNFSLIILVVLLSFSKKIKKFLRIFLANQGGQVKLRQSAELRYGIYAVHDPSKVLWRHSWERQRGKKVKEKRKKEKKKEKVKGKGEREEGEKEKAEKEKEKGEKEEGEK